MNPDPTRTPAEASDRTWFGSEVREMLPSLYGVALRLCGNRADAEDLVAEAVAKAWEALPTLVERSAFRGWIFRILNNHFVSLTRTMRARTVHEPLDGTPTAAFSIFERLHQPFLLWSSDPEAEFLNRVLRDELQHAIAELPDVFRAVVVLVDVQGLRYREVAEILDIPVGTVRSRLARGRGLLQEALWRQAADAGIAAEGRSEQPAAAAPSETGRESPGTRGDR